MRPKHVSEFLSRAIPARLPILLTGAPGVGKTDLVKQSATAAGYELVMSHPVVSDPTDAKGLPWPDAATGTANFLPIGEIAQLLSCQNPTVWLMDDLGQAPAAVQAAYMQWLLARRVNGHILPDHVTIIAATNRRQDRAGVTGILEPVKSRFAAIIPVEPSLDDWSGWALDNSIDPAVIAFLRLRPELLSSDKPNQEIANSPSPRTWHNLARLYALSLPAHIEMAAFTGAVGEGAAIEFVAFLRTFRAMVSIDAILTDPAGSPLPEGPGQSYAVATGLAHRVTPQLFSRIATYVARWNTAGHGEFCALTLRDCLRRAPSITSTGDYIRLVTGPLGKLIMGEAANGD